MTPKRRGAEAFVPSDVARKPGAVVLVASFDGDRDNAVVSHVVDQLSQRPGLDTRLANKILKPSGPGGMVERLVAAAETGRQWLKTSHADILLWGEVADGAVKLRFLTAVSDLEGKPGIFGLGDTLDLPADPSGDLDERLIPLFPVRSTSCM